jgi:ankyrin repeat protein
MQRMARVAGWYSVVGLTVALVLAPMVVSPSWAANKAPDKKTTGNSRLEKTALLGSGNLYALVVGVSHYRDGKIPRLDLADKDAQAFGDFLKSQNKVFRETRVTYLLNEKATKPAIEKYLYYTLPKAGKDDTIILFLSGHGAFDPMRPKEFLFLPFDSESEYMGTTSVKMTGLEFLRGISAERVLIIADACYAGGFSQMKPKAFTPSVELFLKEARNSSGKAIITSAKEGQLSWEVPNRKNSVFTSHLLEGLKGKADRDHDGVVTLNEAYEYAYNRTKDETGGRQHPQFEGQVVGAFPLAFVGPRVPEAELKLQLFHAASSGAASEVERALGLGLEVDARDEDNDTPLIAAARAGRNDIVKILLDKGAEVDATNHMRATALHYAAERGHTAVAKLLLDAGATVSVKDSTGRTPLALAALNGQLNAAELLLDEGAEVKARSETGSTPLTLACAGGRSSVVKLLLEWGADVNTRDLDSWAPLNYAYRNGHAEIVKQLLARGAKIALKEGGRPEKELVRAVLRGDEGRVRKLRAQGARVDFETDSGDTPMTLAAALGYVPVAKVLLEAGARVNFIPDSDAAPLIVAATSGRHAILRLLLDGGARVDARDKEGNTGLLLAAGNGQIEAVRLLLSRNAGVNEKNAKGITPLTVAARNGHTGVVKLLVAKGADCQAADEEGNTALILAAQKGRADAVRVLLSYKADINSKNSQGSTSLIAAAKNGHQDVVNILLAAGADPLIRDWEGKTALTLASEKHRTEVVKLLKSP